MVSTKRSYRTAGKAQLLAYMANSRRPETAEQICAAVSALPGGSPGRSSVYRMLARLIEQGSVKKFPAKQGGFVYQYVGEENACHRHLHLQCSSCGEILHLECPQGEGLVAHIAAEHGFAVDSGHSVLLGLCAACRAAGGAV